MRIIQTASLIEQSSHQELSNQKVSLTEPSSHKVFLQGKQSVEQNHIRTKNRDKSHCEPDITSFHQEL